MKKRNITIVSAIVALGLAACAQTPVMPVTATEAPETLTFALPETGWVRGNPLDDAQQTIVLYLPEGESASGWARLVTYQFLKNDKRAPAEVAEQLRKNVAERCVNTSSWEVLKQDARSLTYEWKIDKCIGQHNHHEIVRWIAGAEGLHRLAFAQKPAIDPADRKQWLKMLASARLAQAPK